MFQKKQKIQWVEEIEKMPSLNKKWCLYINLRKYNIIYDHAIHPIPEYRTSKHGIIYTNIISKYKN